MGQDISLPRAEQVCLLFALSPDQHSTRRRLQILVHLFPVPDSDDQDYQLLTLDRVDDPVVADSNPKKLFASLQLLGTCRSRIVLEGLDPLDNLALSFLREAGQFLVSRLEELDRVCHERRLKPQPLLHLVKAYSDLVLRVRQGFSSSLKVDMVFQHLKEAEILDRDEGSCTLTAPLYEYAIRAILNLAEQIREPDPCCGRLDLDHGLVPLGSACLTSPAQSNLTKRTLHLFDVNPSVRGHLGRGPGT